MKPLKVQIMTDTPLSEQERRILQGWLRKCSLTSKEHFHILEPAALYTGMLRYKWEKWAKRNTVDWYIVLGRETREQLFQIAPFPPGAIVSTLPKVQSFSGIYVKEHTQLKILAENLIESRIKENFKNLGGTSVCKSDYNKSITLHSRT